MSGTLLRVGIASLALGLASSAHAQCTPDKLTASDGASWDYFGESVALSGDTALVGAYEDDDLGEDSGSAYVFERLRGQWVQTAKLVPDDGAAYHYFGWAVALSGDTAIVGAPQTDTGSAYIFERSGGVWMQSAKLYAADGQAHDDFGSAVAIEGDVAVVGAPDAHSGRWTGFAYVFERIGGVWTRTAQFRGSHDNEEMGNAVSVSGDTILVGASSNDEQGTAAGAAHLFERVGGVWTEIAKIYAAHPGDLDYFGHSVSLSGDTAFVGAYRDDDLGENSGSASVFQKIGGVWRYVDTLTASDGARPDQFGYSLSVSGDTAIVGADSDSDQGLGSGSAYVFERIGGAWEETGKLTAPDGTRYDALGTAVALDAGTALVGAPQAGFGAAYAFTVPCDCPPNFNGDYLLDTRDMLAFLNAWVGGDPRADWDQSGTIDTQDVLAFLNDWAAGC